MKKDFVPPTIDTVEIWRHMYNIEHKTYREIGEKYNYPKSTIRNYIKRENNPEETDRKEAIKMGECCVRCTIFFERPHGRKVLCKSCTRDLKRWKRAIDYPTAWIPEKYVELSGKGDRRKYRRKAS